MDNFKSIGGIFIPILSQESSFFGVWNILSGKKHFNQNFLIMKHAKYSFRRENEGFDSNTSSRTHKLFIHKDLKIVTKKSRKE
jgi:hypothetical protein